MNERLKEIRKENKHGKSQQTFAEFLGVSVANVASYESGRRTPSDSFVALICQKCNINEEWLLTGSGEKYRPMGREDELMIWAAEVLKDESDNFKRRFVRMLAALNEDQWELLEDMALKLAGLEKEN